MGLDTSQIDQIGAWAVEVPMRRAFATAETALDARRVVLVKITAGLHSGWGEAAPVEGHTGEDLDATWDALSATAPALLDGTPPGRIGLAAAALSQARADLDAQNAARPLWRHLGGSEEVWASAAIGLDQAGQPDASAIVAAVQSGYRHIKLKISPATDLTSVRRIVSTHPDVTFGADANQALRFADIDLLRTIDDTGLAYIEQPGAADDLAWHRQLCAELATPVALDESAATPAAIDRIVETGAADIVTIKPGRFGTRAALEIARKVVSRGLRARVGGLLESGIGRAHAAALATCREFDRGGDIAASDWYFDDDLVRPQWRLVNGRLVLPQAPGIGVLPNEATIAARAIRSISIG